METLTDRRLAKIKAKRDQANVEPVKKTKKTSKKSTANADNTKEVYNYGIRSKADNNIT